MSSHGTWAACPPCSAVLHPSHTSATGPAIASVCANTANTSTTHAVGAVPWEPVERDGRMSVPSALADGRLVEPADASPEELGFLDLRGEQLGAGVENRLA